VNENTEEGRDKFIKEHLLSIKTHITGLSNKNYHDLYGINSPDYVLLFVPIESSFSIAIQHAQDLFDFAWSKRVVLVTPSTLFATLKTVASIWKQEQQSKNAIEIATKAGALYDKFVGFTEDMKRIGAQINGTQKTYEEAFGKLHTGRGSLTSSVENLKKLGAKASKQLDKNLVDEEDNFTAIE
jgi:DNA recombination protein RmuC